MEKIYGSKVLIKLPHQKQHISICTDQVEKKKKDMAEYRELFTCLFKIKDKDVQQRVLNAINGTNQNNNIQSKVIDCPACKLRSIKLSTADKDKALSSTVTISTQTSDNDFECLRSVNGSNANGGSITNGSLTPEKVMDQQKLCFRMRRQSAPYAKKNDVKAAEKSLAETRKRSEFKERIKKSPAALLAKISRSPSTSIISCTESTFDLGISMPSLLDNEHLRSNLSKEELVSRQMELEWHNAFKLDEENLFPIHFAARENKIKYLKRQMFVFKFLNKDINIRDGSEEENTPLHYAILKDQLNECVNYLLENNGNVMATNKNGETVLHYAVRNTNNLQLFQKLLTKLKNVNDLKALNDNGSTILHLAVSENKWTFVKAIIEYIDQQLTITNDEKNIWQIDQLIEIYQNKMDTPYNFKLYSTKMELINFKENITGRTALALAVNGNNIGISLMLLAHFANPNVADMAGETVASMPRENNEILTTRISRIASVYEAYQRNNDLEMHEEIENITISNKRPNNEMIFNNGKMFKKN